MDGKGGVIGGFGICWGRIRIGDALVAVQSPDGLWIVLIVP